MRAATILVRLSGPLRTRLIARAIAREWSSGLAGAAADEQGLPSAFPWREAPDNRVRGLLNRAMYASMQNSHRKILGLVENVHDDDSFLPAAEMAFVQVAAGVFQMRASQVVSLLVEEGKGQGAGREGVDDGRGEARGGEESSDVLDDIVDPRDVMHEDLANFYLEAAAATKVSRCTPFYRLHTISNSKISNVNIFWGARRGDLPKPGDIVEFMGTAVATESVLKDLETVIRARYFRDRNMLNEGTLSSLRKSTVQVDVDVRCRETFFVVDDRTEEVVQGSKAVGSRTHRLRLECCPILNRDFRWTAVDLDVWMKGNTFW